MISKHSSLYLGSKKYSVLLSGHHTSISLEPMFWNELRVICKKEKKSINQIITEIDLARPSNHKKNLSSEVRIFILKYLQPD